jgi:hypothetical protein
MNPKKMLIKEIVSKVNGHVNEEIVTKKVDQFFKHGNTFILFELINLRNEVKYLREELEKRQKKANSIPTLIFQ